MLLLLFGCPAAQLGIELPPEGIEAISAEDLRRDTELITREGAAGWQNRMESMHGVAEPAGGGTAAGGGRRLCMRQGAGEAPGIVWAPLGVIDGRVPVAEAVDAAALISLAKAWDTMDEKPGARVYCLGEGDGTRVPAFAPNATAVQGIDFRVLATKLRKREL